MLMNMAQVVSQRSTCSRAHVGVIVALDSRPLVSGYNGAPSKMPHCNHGCTCPITRYATLQTAEQALDSANHESSCPAFSPCAIAVHAEANAIAFAAREGVPLSTSTLYTTLEPCYTCAQLIINAGIVEVVYAAPYRDHAGLVLLETAGVRACHLAG